MAGDFFARIGIFLWQTAFIWGGFIVFVIFVRVWIRYVQQRYVDGMEWALMEVKIPTDIPKSPAAMEVVLTSLYDTGGTGNWVQRWIQGKVRKWYSLEVISVEGNIYFFIRVPNGMQRLISTSLYSQFPQAEVQEVDDYTRYVPRYTRNQGWKMYGAEFELVKEDGYPIKTYVDYGLDDTSVDADARIDPMAPMIEFMSSIGPEEQIWIQIVILPARKKPKGLFKPLWQFAKGDDWVDETKELIKEYKKKSMKENLQIVKELDPDSQSRNFNLTKGQEGTVTALERSISKLGFEVGIRAIYIAKEETYKKNIGTMVTPLLHSFRPYGQPGLNSIKPDFDRHTEIDHPWQDINDSRMEQRRESLFDLYVQRAFFYRAQHRGRLWMAPRSPFILNTEELATIYHFPSSTIETPTFERIGSSKSEPPQNLPM